MTRIVDVDGILPCAGLCIKTDDTLLGKIKNNIFLINGPDFLQLDQFSGKNSRIPIFSMTGSLQDPGPKIGDAIKSTSGRGIIFFIGKESYVASLLGIKQVYFGYYSECPIQSLGPIKPKLVYVGPGLSDPLEY